MPPSVKGKGDLPYNKLIWEMINSTSFNPYLLASFQQVANILLAHAGRGGGRGVTEAAAEIARAAAKSWLAPLLDTACDRLAFVLGSLFDLALERHRSHDSECK